MRGGSLEPLVCALEHEDSVGDLEGRAQLYAHDLHNVGLGQQKEGLPVNHLERHNSTKATGNGGRTGRVQNASYGYWFVKDV